MIKTLFAALAIALPMIAAAQDITGRKYVTPKNDTYILVNDRCVGTNGYVFGSDRSLLVVIYSDGSKGTGCWRKRLSGHIHMVDFKTLSGYQVREDVLVPYTSKSD